jgi:hypothetical protein
VNGAVVAVLVDSIYVVACVVCLDFVIQPACCHRHCTHFASPGQLVTKLPRAIRTSIRAFSFSIGRLVGGPWVSFWIAGKMRRVQLTHRPTTPNQSTDRGWHRSQRNSLAFKLILFGRTVLTQLLPVLSVVVFHDNCGQQWKRLWRSCSTGVFDRSFSYSPDVAGGLLQLEIPFLTTEELCTPIETALRSENGIVETASNIQIRGLAFQIFVPPHWILSKHFWLHGDKSSSKNHNYNHNQQPPTSCSWCTRIICSISTWRPPFVMHNPSPPHLSVSTVAFFEVAVVYGFMSPVVVVLSTFAVLSHFWAFCVIMARNPPIRANRLHVRGPEHPVVESSSEEHQFALTYSLMQHRLGLLY